MILVQIRGREDKLYFEHLGEKYQLYVDDFNDLKLRKVIWKVVA